MYLLERLRKNLDEVLHNSTPPINYQRAEPHISIKVSWVGSRVLQ
jgi:hypothetical protein